MRSLKALTLAVGMAALATGAAQAQQQPQPSPAEMLMQYCKPDIERLCPTVPPGEGRLMKCLMAHKMQMSVGCAETLKKLKQMKMTP
ncbi:cysteine rich repeat-containing protein [Segnochrobactrum spirostomi]|uniref:Cysteine rich repeat-containing protein n=1 Tax=Segnochrobactrum spirostomi TaxID=2608987 RepID=A0A6A7XZT4_9HYPH|nr:cysteine rich repeat-containing protein [Segnochrobactrum spirostomi]MQT11846.1 hypothetical protein [Segnochrobactrum spirostomi]